MLETIHFLNNDEDCLKNNFNRKFLFVEKISDLEKLSSVVQLCVIQTDFNKPDLKLIKEVILLNKEIEFWICSKFMSKDNISIANKIGIKNVISSPIDFNMVEEFFNKQNKDTSYKYIDNNYDISSIANSKLMIVDDNPMNIELLKEILGSFNIEVSCFLKPKEAYKAVLDKKFDLFLLDVMMPDMSGFELAKRINDSPLNKNVPIIFISALSDPKSKIKGYNLGSFNYIEKPFDVNIVKAQIFSTLRNKRNQESVTSDKETFMATVAHDLKTPINAGINALNLLLNDNFGSLKEDQYELIEDILNSTKFMQDMVENLLCKEKLENNKMVLSKQVYSLREITEHCIDITKHLLIPKKQKIKFECKVKNTLLPLDFIEIKRVLHNLISNASDYSSDGSKIIIKIFKSGKNLGLSVQDFGKGIDTKNQKDVFLQYMSMAKENKTVGAGLGLYITKGIVEKHGGRIELESKIGRGTKITVFLPVYDKE
jgi:two-component system sensor histidine kinase/response regulator